MEKEVIDGAELREFIKQHDPGPHLVPGTLPVSDERPQIPADVPSLERRVEGEK